PRRRGAEFYDTLLWRVQPKQPTAGDGFAIGVTSADRHAGVSTVAANLAIRAADHRQSPVLLIDANLLHPRQQRNFRLRGGAGLTDLLAGECGVGEAVFDSGVDGLSVMPLGSPSLVERTVCDHDAVAALFAELRGDYATLVFDLPPANAMRHTLLFAQQLDATLMAVRSEATRTKAARAAVARLQADGVAVTGSVVTQQKRYTPRWLSR
ncbi:MAG: CpsD/CapB family tyrosine-protein kinase, partial [Planctomycetota bacterium]